MQEQIPEPGQVTQPAVQIETTQIAPQAETKQNSWKIIAIVLALLLLVTGGLLVYLLMQNGEKQVAKIQPTTTQVSPVATAVSETATLKTYTDSKNKLSFQYPSNLMPQDIGNGVISFSENGVTKFSYDGVRVYPEKEYQQYLTEKKNNGTLLDPRSFVDSQGRTWDTDMMLGEVYNFTGVYSKQGMHYVVDLQSGPGEVTMNPDGSTDDGSKFMNFANQILSTVEFN